MYIVLEAQHCYEKAEIDSKSKIIKHGIQEEMMMNAARKRVLFVMPIPVGMMSVEIDRRMGFMGFRNFGRRGVESFPESRNHLGEPVDGTVSLN
jgi:hypothetical protein